MENIIVTKSKNFAVGIVNAYKYLTSEKNEYVMSKQLLRSGTSIGANVKEGIRGQSKPDFYAKFNIALKEASETEYWLEILYETNYIDEKLYESINSDCEEIIRLLVSITKTQNNSALRIPNSELK